jgi:hypothetical protein
VWQTIVEFYVCGILPVIGVLQLKSVIFIEEFQVQFAGLSNGGSSV